MTRSGVSAETLFGYKWHQEQKQTGMTHPKASRTDSLIEADGALLSPFGDSFVDALNNAAGSGGHAVHCPAWLLQRRERHPGHHVAGANA